MEGGFFVEETEEYSMGESVNGGADSGLKSELLHALFTLKNLHFHRIGHQKFGGHGGHGHHGAMKGGLGLNVPEFVLLKKLKLREEKGESGGALLSEMCEHLSVSKAAVSQMLGGLEKRGFITRETDPENRRTIIVRPTAKGFEVIERFEYGFDARIGTLIERFGEDDTREIIRLIYRFADIVGELRADSQGESDIGEDK
jgi:DNA-binding MarR family transcriptional regulator